MPDIFDFDDGNGVYDVVTRQDYERWQDEAQKEVDRKNREMLPEDDRDSPSPLVPF